MRKIVIGIGNPLKKDDNIGNLIVDKLKKITNDDNILFIRAETNPENFISKIKSFDPNIIYFIDAVDFNKEIGEVKVFKIDDVLNESLSTHGISVKVFKDFFPDTEIYVVGIKVEDIGYGEELSKSLKLDDISNKVKNILYQRVKLHYGKEEKK